MDARAACDRLVSVASQLALQQLVPMDRVAGGDGVSLRDVLRSSATTLRECAASLKAELEAKQARIDALMLEFCPGEMSEGQRANWAEHQRPVDPSATCALDGATL